MPKWLKISLKILAALFLFLIILVIGVSLYITYRKDKFLKLVNLELNKNVEGTVLIGDLHPQFFRSFPEISLGLENVMMRDQRFAQHRHTLLDARHFDISLNAADLLTGKISIRHIAISDAAIDLYTDSTGYSNTSLLKKSRLKNTDKFSKNGSSAEIEKFSFRNVGFKVDDRKAKKLFDFVVNDLDGHLSYPDTGWHASFHLDVIAKSMAFSTRHGSFVKNKAVEGDFVAGFNQQSGKTNVFADALDIGDDPFRVSAVFDQSRPGTGFSFHIAAGQLLWRHAAALLSQNISVKLDQFDLVRPIAVTAVISGSFAGSDPLIYVTAKIRHNTIDIPGSQLLDCSFDGIFTNNGVNGKGLTDENSVIRLMHLDGNYHHVPFRIDTGSISNLVNPIATGNLRSTFPIADLNYLLADRAAKFGKGVVTANLRYQGDIENYRINKPVVTGTVNVKHADINKLVGDLSLKNTSFSLDFTKDDLLLRGFKIQTGRSTVFLDGRVNHFMNLYYKDPEKILLTLNVRSPQMYLAEFIGFLNKDDQTVAASQTPNSGNIISQFGNVFRKGNAHMYLAINKLYYNKFLATDVHADLLTTRDGLVIQHAGLKTSGGTLRLNGSIQRAGKANGLSLNTVVSNVDVHDFFYSFDNFGLKDFTYENLKGLLSAKTEITAGMNNKASLVPNTINGNLDVSLRDGALVNFRPILGVGKYAFPFRDLKNIKIPKMDAHFAVHGDRIEISPLQISSSVLNLDVAGTYGLITGTDISLDIPLRNPKGDTTIMDKAELKKKRFRGIVLHLRAKSDESGKIKIGLNKKNKDSGN